MDFMHPPMEPDVDPYGLRPLEWDDEGCDDEDDADGYPGSPFDDDYENEYEEPGLGGFDDLTPFGSFDDGYGWEGGWL